MTMCLKPAENETVTRTIRSKMKKYVHYVKRTPEVRQISATTPPADRRRGRFSVVKETNTVTYSLFLNKESGFPPMNQNF